MATARIGLAAVLLNESRLRSAKTYAASIQEMLRGVPVSIMESTNEVRALKVGDSEVYIPLLPPYPWSDLEPLAKNAWHWKAAGNELRTHKAHILVTLRLGPDDPIERAMLLSKVTAAVVASQECLGVYWQGPAISRAKMFLKSVKEAVDGGHYPLLSWVSFAVVREESGVTVVTQGMEELGHKELEVLGLPGDDTALEYALTMCDHVLMKGPILKHGETTGRTPGERFLITHRPWRWDNAKQAIEIDMRKNVSKVKVALGRLFRK